MTLLTHADGVHGGVGHNQAFVGGVEEESAARDRLDGVRSLAHVAVGTHSEDWVRWHNDPPVTHRLSSHWRLTKVQVVLLDGLVQVLEATVLRHVGIREQLCHVIHHVAHVHCENLSFADVGE